MTMFSGTRTWLSNLFQRKPAACVAPRRSQRPQCVQLEVECLEDRLVPTITTPKLSISQTGLLSVAPGQIEVLTVTISNASTATAAAKGLVIQEKLPADATFVSGSPLDGSKWQEVSPDVYSLTPPASYSIAAGKSVKLILDLKVSETARPGAAFHNVVTVDATGLQNPVSETFPGTVATHYSFGP
jgi:uncharacterized repeat protein (TIGR01451 family)